MFTTANLFIQGRKLTIYLFCRFRYPSKIKVDENDVEVNFSSGVLKIELKIIQILDENTGKLMAFKGKTKAAAKASKAPVKPETPSESEESDVEDGENGLNSDEEVSDEQMDVSAESESSEEPVAPKAKSKTATRSKAPASVRLGQFTFMTHFQ